MSNERIEVNKKLAIEELKGLLPEVFGVEAADNTVNDWFTKAHQLTLLFPHQIGPNELLVARAQLAEPPYRTAELRFSKGEGPFRDYWKLQLDLMARGVMILPRKLELFWSGFINDPSNLLHGHFSEAGPTFEVYASAVEPTIVPPSDLQLQITREAGLVTVACENFPSVASRHELKLPFPITPTRFE